MHLRSIFLLTNWCKSKALVLVNEVCFATMFFFARVVFGPILLYKLWISTSPLMMKIAGVGLFSLSLYWFYLILTTLINRMRSQKKPSSSVQDVL
jgi:hypothetical protein